ncbi:YrpD family protein [Paenibacillus zanthoxyli]|uniref:YrpD family protein n=1 Tax=Paenibacillus zanthoxyli TaxID=369399 RepID=UPI00046F5126|nr:YrpD family protein [Paenibacillus zanthoxyli]
MNYSKKLLVPLLILSFAAFPVSAFAKDAPATASLDLSNVNVVHQESQEVAKNKLAIILDVAKNAVAEERRSKVSLARVSDQSTYDYITFDDQYTYFYEEAANQEPQLIVVDKAETNVESLLSQDLNDSSFNTAAATAGTGFVTDGVGGRINVTTTGSAGSYLMALMSLPEVNSSVVSLDRPTHIAFNYGGFEYTSTSTGGIGSWAADMGLELYNNLGPSSTSYAWKPVIILKKKNRVTTTKDSGWDQYATAFASGYDQVQNKNGYKPGTSPLIYWWYNYNGKVRMKIDGWAISPNLGGYSLSDTNLITILESSASWNIPSISRWKLLSTVVSNDDTGKNSTTFSSLQLNGAALASGALSSPQNDHSNVTVNSSTSVSIVVNSSIY